MTLKYHILETPNLLTNADSSTYTFFCAGVAKGADLFLPPPPFFFVAAKGLFSKGATEATIGDCQS